MNKIFTEKAILHMRDEIVAAAGNEVFFVGRTDEARLVVEVEPLARGNRDAVAAIIIAASFGDVVIHNHPSGNLTPSQADVEIASILGNQGVGFYLVNNEVTRCYQAVSPFFRQETQRLNFPELERFFAGEGALAGNLKGYEHRTEQVRMAFAVAEAFNDDKVAMIEAGTGTGKSLAYLYPAALWAVRNRERVVISTNTINLQEQLTKKDIPFLQKYGGIDFRAVLVKGRSNYLCFRKLEAVRSEPSLFKDDAAAELDAIALWSEKTSDGCRGDLSFIPQQETWEEIGSEADQCGRVKCPFYTRCFFYRARREASTADILVVNHALLMADVTLRQQTGYSASAVLPPFQRLIFDEGHHLEDVATSYFSMQTSRQGLLHLMGRLQHPRKAQAGILPRLSSRLSNDIPENLEALYMELAGILETELIPRRASLVDSVSRTMDNVGMALRNHLQGKTERTEEHKLRLSDDIYATPFWLEVEPKVRELDKDLRAYAALLNDFLKSSTKLPDKVLERMSGHLLDLKGIKGRLEATAGQLQFFISREEGICRWFEVKNSRKGMAVKLCSAPLEVAESVKSGILDKFKTVIVTSATLAVGEKFDYLEKRTGIALLERERVTELLLSSPFDYAHQAFVGIPSDMPQPGGSGFEKALQEFLLQGLTFSQGRAFVLFTSFELLTRLYGSLQQALTRRGLTPMRQGELNRHLLLNRFKKEPNAVLFGTDSFWEGVDVKGKALELVAITRLPFRVPTEPILEARAEHLSKLGGDPFMEYTVPQAVIKFKQGFGRLIRSRDDRGAVLICDSRVLSKHYGRFFLQSLPKARVVKGEAAKVLQEMDGFFSSSAASPSSQQS